MQYLVHTCVHIAVSGSATKQVQCESCCNQYSYEITRTFAQDVLRIAGLIRYARSASRRVLKRMLRDGVDPVACPACGWMQAAMTRELRRRWCPALRKAGQWISAACLMILALLGIGAVWLRVADQTIDGLYFDWRGFGTAMAIGVAFGMLLSTLRVFLARLRYPVDGFLTRTPPANRLAA